MTRKATVTGRISSNRDFHFTCGYDWTLHSIIGMKTLYYPSDSEIASRWAFYRGQETGQKWVKLAQMIFEKEKQQKKATTNLKFDF